MKIKNGHVAVITGAGGGLGSALAKDLAARGCHLALVDISEAALQETASQLSAHAGRVTQHIVDVTDQGQMEALSQAVLSAHGTVNLLINNAGITLQKNFSTHSLEDWQRIVGINFWGVVHGCHFFDEALTAAQDAHIVNLSSMSAFVGLPAQSSYCATKAAVQGLTDSLWAEWSMKGTGVTSIHPGAIRTEMITATLEESDDIEAAKRNYAIAQKTGIDADRAAAKILRAVERNKMRQRIGKDAYLIDYITRFTPWLANWAMKKIAQTQAR